MAQDLKKREENREYYSHSDMHFMDLERSMYASRFIKRYAWVRDWVHDLKSESHIDIGCKDGSLCIQLQSEGVNTIGIDPSEDAIDFARLKALQAGLKCSFFVGYGEDLPEGIQADTVSCTEVIEHVIDPEALLERLAKTATYVMISTPDKNGKFGEVDLERNPEHIRLYTKESLEELCNKYGTIRESKIEDGNLLILFESKFI